MARDHRWPAAWSFILFDLNLLSALAVLGLMARDVAYGHYICKHPDRASLSTEIKAHIPPPSLLGGRTKHCGHHCRFGVHCDALILETLTRLDFELVLAPQQCVGRSGRDLWVHVWGSQLGRYLSWWAHV